MKVKDLMVSADEYKSVGTDATLSDVAAIMGDGNHQDVLVVNDNGDLVGIISMADILMAIEPNYKKLSQDVLDSDVLSNAYVTDLFKQFDLWDDPLDALCERGADTKADAVMYVPKEGDYLHENDRLEYGIHRYITGVHQPILVRSNGAITGVLRFVDVFDEIKKRMLTCVE